MSLDVWLRTLSPGTQQDFFKQASVFFSNRELGSIIAELKSGANLYDAHRRTGVLDRYAVDLERIRNNYGRKN